MCRKAASRPWRGGVSERRIGRRREFQLAHPPGQHFGAGGGDAGDSCWSGIGKVKSMRASKMLHVAMATSWNSWMVRCRVTGRAANVSARSRTGSPGPGWGGRIGRRSRRRSRFGLGNAGGGAAAKSLACSTVLACEECEEEGLWDVLCGEQRGDDQDQSEFKCRRPSGKKGAYKPICRNPVGGWFCSRMRLRGLGGGLAAPTE